MTPYGKSDPALLRDLGRRMKMRRLAKNLSQSQVAEAAGLGRSTICALEKGDTTTVLSLVQVLRVLGALEDLENLVPDMGPSPLEVLKTKRRTRQRASGTRRREGGARKA